MIAVRIIVSGAVLAFVWANGACSSFNETSDAVSTQRPSSANGGASGNNDASGNRAEGGSNAGSLGESRDSGAFDAGISGSGGASGHAGASGVSGYGGAATAGSSGSAGASGQSGSVGAAGESGNGGAATAGASGSAGAVTCSVTWTGSATRPQLDDASARCYTIRNYLAQSGAIGALTRDDWDPTAGIGDVSAFNPTYTVATDGSGTHTSVQAAIDAAVAAGGTDRVYILVKAGTYRELVCVKGSVPITLYGADSDASKVTIVFDNYSGKAIDTTHTNACVNSSGATYGTSGSSTFFVNAKGFQAKNLTIANDFAEGSQTVNIQAVALSAQADRLVFENLRLIGNQDTLQVKTPNTETVARSYFKSSIIEGDVDFIFGRGTAVFDGCTIRYVTRRKSNGAHFAPSTESTNGFGFLVVNSKIVSDTATPAATTYLGRSWDEGSSPTINGHLVIRNSEIGAHVVVAAPWADAATTGRPFNAATNRLYEYKNTGSGAAR